MQDVPIIGRSIGKPIAHGGDLSAIRRRYPDAPEPWIDLSTGISPLAYPVADLSPEAWSRLPSREAEQALIAAAAARADEAECLRFFGPAYHTYMTKTKRFIPFVF